LPPPPGQLLPTLPGGLEAGLLGLDLASGPDGDLTAVLLALSDHGCDLVVAVFEDLPEQEDRPLDRGEALQQHQEGHGQGVGRLGVLGDVVGDHRLGQPCPDVALPADPGRAQVIDAEPRGDRRQVGFRRLDRRPFADLPMEPQERFLDDVLCLARTP
jgi:hypothetical protein